jgi:hypothetical protein
MRATVFAGHRINSRKEKHKKRNKKSANIEATKLLASLSIVYR